MDIRKKKPAVGAGLKVVLAFPRARNQNLRDDSLCLLLRHVQRAYEAIFAVSFLVSRIGPCVGRTRLQNPVQRLPGNAQSGRRVALVSVGAHQRQAHLFH